jgi:MSHA biogenesis protein MshK
MSRSLFVMLLFVSGAALAQRGGLVDPTRPPTIGTEPRGKESAAPAGPQLQSVLISPTRRVAVISGNTVVQGAKYGGATVASITESEVLLRYPDRKETLRLIPDVVKRERRADAEYSEKGNTR